MLQRKSGDTSALPMCGKSTMVEKSPEKKTRDNKFLKSAHHTESKYCARAGIRMCDKYFITIVFTIFFLPFLKQASSIMY